MGIGAQAWVGQGRGEDRKSYYKAKGSSTLSPPRENVHGAASSGGAVTKTASLLLGLSVLAGTAAGRPPAVSHAGLAQGQGHTRAHNGIRRCSQSLCCSVRTTGAHCVAAALPGPTQHPSSLVRPARRATGTAQALTHQGVGQGALARGRRGAGDGSCLGAYARGLRGPP